jgi:hypothetical protein
MGPQAKETKELRQWKRPTGFPPQVSRGNKALPTTLISDFWLPECEATQFVLTCHDGHRKPRQDPIKDFNTSILIPVGVNWNCTWLLPHFEPTLFSFVPKGTDPDGLSISLCSITF